MIIALLVCGLFLAYANGANDNFKGVATLYGSGLVSYKKALAFTTVATFLGSVTSIFIAQALIAAFSGKGLVPNAVAELPIFALSVSAAAAITVMIATRFGFPISTTHALTGALVGSGLTAAVGGVAFAKLGSAFFLPLLLSPIFSLILAFCFYPLVEKLVPSKNCVCVSPAVAVNDNVVAATANPFIIADTSVCDTAGASKVLSFDSKKTIDGLHFISAGLVCFARGLNDTPKLAALLLMVPFLNSNTSITAIAVVMAFGGLIHSRKIAETMSHKLTTMNHEQGFAANFITAIVVNLGSKYQLPVSTTHVSVGTLFGIGLKTKKANASMVKQILAAWIFTLPVAALFGFAFFNIIQRMH